MMGSEQQQSQALEAMLVMADQLEHEQNALGERWRALFEIANANGIDGDSFNEAIMNRRTWREGST